MSHALRWFCAGVAAMLAGGLAGVALAAGPVVVVVEGVADDPVVARLLLELRSSGFVVQTGMDRRAPASRGAGEGEEQAAAILRVTSAETVEDWLVDPVTRAGHVIETIRVERPRAEHAGVVAVRVVETLRARLLPVAANAAAATTAGDAGMGSQFQDASVDDAPLAPMDSASLASAAASAARTPPDPLVPTPSSPVPEKAPAPPIRQTAVTFARAHVGVDVAPLLLVSPGGVPATLDLMFAARWMPFRALAVRALVGVPLLSPDVVSTQGSASCATWLGGAALDWGFVRNASWAASVGGGVSAAWLTTRGNATAPFVSSRGGAVSALPFVTIRGARSLGTPRLRLAVQGLLGAAIPDVGIHFAGHAVATWGLPLVGLSLGLELDAL